MQYAFGSGSMFITPTGADQGGSAGPRRIGQLQGVSLDMAGQAKDARTGAAPWALQGARGAVRVTGKADFARFTADGFNALFFGGPQPAAGMTRTRVDEPQTIAAGAATVAHAATYLGDLGVVGADDGLVYTRVSAGPVGLQYTADGAGGYGFDPARDGAAVLISYSYDDPGSGYRIGVANRLIGHTPTFSLVLTETFNGKAMTLTMPYCTARAMSWAAKPEDFTVPSFSFAAAADESGLLGTWSMEEGAPVPDTTETLPGWDATSMRTSPSPGASRFTLSSDGRTARFAGSGSVSDFHNNGLLARRPRRAGRYYFEFRYTVECEVGWCSYAYRDDFLVGGSSPCRVPGGWYYYNHVSSITYAVLGGGSLTVSAPTAAAGDVVRMAVDIDADKLWVGLNGAWIGGGDPAAGTLPTFGRDEFPSFQILPGMPAADLSTFSDITTTIAGRRPELAYPCPAGFLPWHADDYPQNDAT